MNVANSSQFGPCSRKNSFQFIDNFAHNATAYGSDVEDAVNSVNNINNCNFKDVYGNRTNLVNAISIFYYMNITII